MCLLTVARQCEITDLFCIRCVLQSCIVCNNCRIEDRAVLKDCIIGADMIIAKDGMSE